MAAAPYDIASEPHDHAACVDDALARAEALCERRGVRLTPVRRQVLELVWRSHRPRGAYDILDDLTGDGRRPAPLTVYRALDFLVAQGFAHRLESLNAFVGCIHPGERHPTQFLVCSDCGAATELHDLDIAEAIDRSAADRGFTIERPIVEIRGLCPLCRDRSGRDKAGS